MLVLRQVKGAPLTIAEEDGNFTYLLSLFETINSGAFVKTDGSTPIFNPLTYDSLVTLSDNKQLVHKKYVDDAISTIDLSGYLPLTAGASKALSGNLYFGDNGIIDLSSIISVGVDHYYNIQLDKTAGTISLISGKLAGATSGFQMGGDAASFIYSLSDSNGLVVFGADTVNGLKLQTNGVQTNIKNDNVTNVYTAQLPDKTGDQTFAMLSDLTSFGTGTVTNVSIVTANGFSGSVANSSTTPAITLTLQNASSSQSGQLTSTDWNTFNNKQPALGGTGFVKISGTTISYDNSTYLTANQTITLSGDVSGSGTTGITTTIGAGKVTNSMLAGSIDLTTKVTGLLPDANIASASTWNAKVSSQWVTTGSDIYYSTGNVMIGQASAPLSKLHLVENSTSTLRGVIAGQYSSDTLSSQLNLRKARGTYSSPTTVVTGDVISNINSAAYDGTNFLNAASIRVTSVGTIGTGITPTKIELLTMTAAGVLTTALTLDQSQNVLIGNDIYMSSAKGVRDANGNLLLAFPSTVASAVNYIQLDNKASGTGPIFSAKGTDSNIDITFQSKGTGSNINLQINGAATVLVNNTGLALADGKHIQFGSTNGTKLGITSSQRWAAWGATPIAQPTTAVASATYVSNVGTPITSADTFDGYTLAQLVRLIRLIGLAA